MSIFFRTFINSDLKWPLPGRFNQQTPPVGYLILKREFEEKKYPFEIEKSMGMVEFVATSTKYRGKGVATTIMNYIFVSTSYGVYALEVADTNTNAVNLYKKLGYTEFLRIKQKHSKRSGINHLVYMKYSKNNISEKCNCDEPLC